MARKPKQVQDAIDKAKELEALVFGTAGDPPIPDPILEVVPPEPVIPVEPVVIEPPVEPAPVIDDGNSETWKHRFEVIQGKYDKEVPRLHDKIDRLEQMIANISVKPVEPVVVEPPKPKQKRATQEQFEEFLRDYKPYYDIMLDEIDARVEDTSKIKEELEALKKTQTTSTVEKLYESLVEAVPDWQTINADPLFSEWLEEREGYSNMTKLQLLEDAFKKNEAKRVIKFFTDFKATLVPAAPTKPNLAGKVVPAGSPAGSITPASTVDTSKIKQSTITKYYQDLALRKIHPTPKEKEAQEQVFHKAMLDGRVIYNQ